MGRWFETDLLISMQTFWSSLKGNDLLPEGGFIADAGDDWGYAAPADRRKTLLWSRWPLVDAVRLDLGAGKGRVVLASIEGPFGHLNSPGVCIPWASAHVATGRRNAKT